MSWGRLPLKRALRMGGKSSGLIKGAVSAEPTPELYPGFSASGQDVWLEEATFQGDGLVLSAVGARCGKVFQASGEWGTVANTVVLLPTKGHDARFLWYLINNEGFWEKGGTAQPYVRVEETLNRRITLPDYSTQCTIADYLDCEIARIDALIAAKRRMVELLEERWLCAARRLLTGADSVSQRWSPGPYWLNPVPRSWRPHKIAWCKATGSGTTPESGRGLYYVDEGGIPWVTTTELRETDIFTTSRTITEDAMRDYSALKIFPPGTVLIAMYGATVGRLGVLQTHATVNQACCAIWGAGDLDQDFAYWWLLTFRSHIVDMAYGSGQPNISQETVRSLRIPAPELDEQQNIVASLQISRRAVELVSRQLAKQITLLRERRDALITATVTGQLDIPDAA